MDNYFHIHVKENNKCLQGRTLPSEFKEASAADTVRLRGRVWKDEGRSKEDRVLLGLCQPQCGSGPFSWVRWRVTGPLELRTDSVLAMLKAHFYRVREGTRRPKTLLLQ